MECGSYALSICWAVNCLPDFFGGILASASSVSIRKISSLSPAFPGMTAALPNLVGARQLLRNHEPVLALPRTHGLGVVERNSFRFFPAVRFARSNGTNGTEKT